MATPRCPCHHLQGRLTPQGQAVQTGSVRTLELYCTKLHLLFCRRILISHSAMGFFCKICVHIKKRKMYLFH